ncbi:Six-hairpin glycosidase [Hymenopellis radicata]|nr:Six-hairpin glycosidase [Hymenopellis radicata]
MLSAASLGALLVLVSPAVSLAAPRDTVLPYPVLADIENAEYILDINSTLASKRGLEKRACSSYDTAAVGTGNALQSLYYNSGGYYNGGSAWTDVNGVEDLMNQMLYDGTTTWDGIPEAVITNYDSMFTNSPSYDDLGWATLMSWKQCDYLKAHGGDTTECTNRALKYYNIIVGAWDSTCGGGVWWNGNKDYKNAITNELFIYASALGYLRTGQSGLLSNAQLVRSSLSSTNMRNSDGLYNDGLTTSTCSNNGQTTWTYNQIVVASGLSAIYSATGDSSYLDAAQVSIDATIARMESNSILKESCDDASGASECDADQQLFKGIFMKHLQYFLDTANSATLTAKYAGFINAQASGIVHYATGAGYRVGSVWYAANAGGSLFTPKSQSSGMAGLVCAAKYANC